MDKLIDAFNERLKEIDEYLDLLDALEIQVQSGLPQLGGKGPVITTITATQQRMLYASVYLQLYNLVESTVSKCINALTSAISDQSRWQPGHLSDKMRNEWVRHVARTHVDLNYPNRLIAALNVCDHIVNALPITQFEIEKGGGGNWDDLSINDISERLGVSLQISLQAKTGIKRHFRNDKGALLYIKGLRNDLAHGEFSFSEGGRGITARELRELKERTSQYLIEVTESFQTHIDLYYFLEPNHRPVVTP